MERSVYSSGASRFHCFSASPRRIRRLGVTSYLHRFIRELILHGSAVDAGVAFIQFCKTGQEGRFEDWEKEGDFAAFQ